MIRNMRSCADCSSSILIAGCRCRCAALTDVMLMQGYDVMEEMYNEKTAAMNFVHELCKVRTKGNLEAFMALCINVMNEYQVRPSLWSVYPMPPGKACLTSQMAECQGSALITRILTKSGGTSTKIRVFAAQAAGQNPTKEQSRRMDGAFLAIGALNDVLKSTVSAFLTDSHGTQLDSDPADHVRPYTKLTTHD